MSQEKKWKILIVDDDDIIRGTYIEVFGDHGFEAKGAKDGVEGLDVATKEKFDVIMTGIIMPRMDGFKLIESLQENVETKKVPVAIISHLGREEDRIRAKEKGIETFIMQGSMTPREIVDKLKGLIVSSNTYQISFDYNAWDAPALGRKIDIPEFKCPNCANRMILELTQKAEGRGFDAFFKCPKCDLHL